MGRRGGGTGLSDRGMWCKLCGSFDASRSTCTEQGKGVLFFNWCDGFTEKKEEKTRIAVTLEA